jgi:nucleoid DNA-binding protein
MLVICPGVRNPLVSRSVGLVPPRTARYGWRPAGGTRQLVPLGQFAIVALRTSKVALALATCCSQVAGQHNPGEKRAPVRWSVAGPRWLSDHARDAFSKERESKMPSPLSKSALVEAITKIQTDGLSKRQVKSVLEALATVGHKELKKSGMFVVPGFAKFVVVKKPATKARKGINPFTKEPTVFKAKPARKVVRARPVKAIKDAVA